jgi:PHP family Zn ribbon phosphoesterase
VDTPAAAKAFKSYYQAGTLANSHKNADLSCNNCHTTYDYDELDNMAPKCKNCHGDYPDLAKRTANTGYETNPHKSHFPNLACTKCHSMHGDFKDYCSEKCHKWGFNWKQKLKK